MAHAETCPICCGEGRIIDEATRYQTCPQKIVCHGCSGKGWIEVRDESDVPWELWPTITSENSE